MVLVIAPLSNTVSRAQDNCWHEPCLDGKPPGPNCRGRYPWAIKGCGDYFSADVVGAIDIGVDDPLTAGIIPASVTPATETRFSRTCGIVNRDLVSVKEAGTARVAFHRVNHPDSPPVILFGKQLNIPGIRGLPKLLIWLISPIHRLV